ncbi:hypothetical protein EV363DRAFT_1386457 [Boletus edulis]|nr:hypothetical protein EV363DRAFT_1386457 [Boletus edulis]
MSSTFNVKVIVQPNGVKLSEVHFSVHFPDNISVEGEVLPEYITPGKWAGLLPAVRPSPQDGTSTKDSTPLSDVERWKIPVGNRRYPGPHHDFQGCLPFSCASWFWMAFVAAYPTFPRDTWPSWDSHIAMEGDSVSQWVVNRSDELCRENDDAIRMKIWKEFSTAVELTLLIHATR